MSNPISAIEHAQKILANGEASLDQLSDGALALQQIIAAAASDLDEVACRRTIEMASTMPAGELDKRLDLLDKREKEVIRRAAIAKAVLAQLVARIDDARVADAADKRQAAYDEAIKLHVAATNLVREFLDKFGPECRRVLRAYAESESKSAAANQNLPPDTAPIRSIESERRGELRSPKTTMREFKAFVHGMRRIAEQGSVEAAPEKDGRWSVYIPGGSTSGGNYLTCNLIDFVEVTTETDAPPWLDFLATSLSVPAFFVTQHPAWRPITADNLGPVFPDQIVRELDRLEAQPPHHFPPRIDTRVMPLAAWREMNGEGVEVPPAPVAVAAE